MFDNESNSAVIHLCPFRGIDGTFIPEAHTWITAVFVIDGTFLLTQES